MVNQARKACTFKARLMLGYGLQDTVLSFTDIANIVVIAVNFVHNMKNETLRQFRFIALLNKFLVRQVVITI